MDDKKEMSTRELETRIAALEQLLEVYETIVLDQSKQLNENLKKMEEVVREKTAKLSQSVKNLEMILEHVPVGIMMVDQHKKIIMVNSSAARIMGKKRDDILGTKCHQSVCPSEMGKCPVWDLNQKIDNSERLLVRENGNVPILKTVIPIKMNEEDVLLEAFVDISDQKKAEREKEKMHLRLLQAQKLESVGQLAAGIAHEINTPTQFISSNIDFMDEAVRDICACMEQIQQIADSAPKELGDKIRDALEEADWEYLAEELPLAITQSWDGVKRISTIVRAMKEFSHPGSKEKQPADLNQIINTTVTVARNEWKYVADMEMDLDPELPNIPLLASEMGQVILNMLVNAAQAIDEKQREKPNGEKGIITITTRELEDGVELRLRDTGAGIPEEARPHIFDFFYTTKEVGFGTGQGLAISHDVITQKHDGTLTFETELGKGTTFIIRIPLKDR